MDRRIFHKGDQVVFIERKFPFEEGDTAFINGPARVSDTYYRGSWANYGRDTVVPIAFAERGPPEEVPTMFLAQRMPIYGTTLWEMPLGRVRYLDLRYNPNHKDSPHLAVLLDMDRKDFMCLPNTNALRELFEIEREHRISNGIPLDTMIIRGVEGLFTPTPRRS